MTNQVSGLEETLPTLKVDTITIKISSLLKNMMNSETVILDNIVKKKSIHKPIFQLYSPMKVSNVYIAPLTAIGYKPSHVSFQSAMKYIVIIGQCFGLNPVLGVSEKDSAKLRFRMISWRFFYSLMLILGQLILLGWCFFDLISDPNFNLYDNAFIAFYLSNCITSMIFLCIAKKWPKLCRQIKRMEIIDPNLDKNLAKTINLSCVVILALATVEHLLSDLSRMAGVVDCRPDTNPFEAYTTSSPPWMFNYIQYNHVFGILIKIINLQLTFTWNFSHIFLISMSIYLSSRYNQINQRIFAVTGKYAPPSFWRTMRKDYTRVSELVKDVDDVIGGIIFVSFANNLFSICVQLFHTLKDGVSATPSCRPESPDARLLKGYEQAVYFVYSFGFLLVRSLALALIASCVHTSSKKPIHALYDVPSNAYCMEVKRFMDQIHGEVIALSGLQFFYVKRGLVLAIAGTIVTYELVLLQFAGNHSSPPPEPTPNSIFNTSNLL